ncbi:MAG: LysR family transcriptional regulator [Myxococcota bacterium]
MEPPDSDERVFLRIVEGGSLKAAAAQLGVDPSAVSRRLAALEARLGLQLLQRSTRGSVPTDVGARYYEGLADIVAREDALEASLKTGDAPSGHLRVTAPPEFGVRFVVPVLEALERAHPLLSVELSLGTGFADLGAAGIDVAVRIGSLADSSLRARRLGSVPRTLVAAPAYLEAHGTPGALAELEAHTFVGYLGRGGSFPIRTEHHGQTRLRARFTVNSIPTLVRLVEDGRGLFHGPLWAMDAALAAGRVVRVLPELAFPAFPVHALYGTQRYVPAKTRAFVDAMVASVAGEASLAT